MANVVLDKVSKRFGSVAAVDEISLDMADGEFVVLIGPSGCGKSTTLRMVAGLEPVSGGQILFDGQVVNNLPPKHRDIAMVFQSYALYPHMTVAQNMAFGLKLKGYPKEEIRQRVDKAAGLLNIRELLGRKPRELSGGQRQRVAMGRAIVRDPKAFLFDEPLSNLDANLRAQMRVEIKRLHQQLETTVVYVTHDQIEAMTLADRIVLMKNGKIVQVGPPMEVYDNPVNKFSATFIGAPKMNFIPGRLVRDGADGLAIEIEGGRLAVAESRRATYEPMLDQPVEIGLRPEYLAVGKADRPGTAEFEAVIDVVEPMGSEALAFFRLGDVELAAKCDPHNSPRHGERVSFRADMTKMHLIDPRDESVVQVAR
ncbi:MAG: sn-glycerol-3-phosphate ABC transporter ATP-binding protein UgpC [Ectothiorhodospiraceae bacterium]|nr:sn-glycerol-3-phosphate ABC transporter ATP-binding protein UgpC [Ectothiorhodospiraceae bacterium]